MSYNVIQCRTLSYNVNLCFHPCYTLSISLLCESMLGSKLWRACVDDASSFASRELAMDCDDCISQGVLEACHYPDNWTHLQDLLKDLHKDQHIQNRCCSKTETLPPSFRLDAAKKRLESQGWSWSWTSAIWEIWMLSSAMFLRAAYWDIAPRALCMEQEFWKPNIASYRAHSLSLCVPKACIYHLYCCCLHIKRII